MIENDANEGFRKGTINLIGALKIYAFIIQETNACLVVVAEVKKFTFQLNVVW
jgi:hypothetical protein